MMETSFIIEMIQKRTNFIYSIAKRFVFFQNAEIFVEQVSSEKKIFQTQHHFAHLI